METEIWKDILGYEGKYKISSLGRVKSLYNRFGKGKILKPCKSKGYFQIYLSNNGKKAFSVHRLVAQEFIPNPENKPQVNHINGIRDDNRIENLEYCTASENILHSYRVLLRSIPICMKGKFGKDNPNSKEIVQLSKEGNFIKNYISITTASKELGILETCISACCNGRRGIKTAGGFIWKFKI